MKNLIIAVALISTSFVFGQVDEVKTTTTETTILEDEEGKKMTASKEIEKNVSEEIQLKNSSKNKVNYTAKRSNRMVDYDVTYSFGGNNYSLKKMNNGMAMYQMKNPSRIYATLNPTKLNGIYTFSKNGNNSIAYFNKNNNLVVETFDAMKNSTTVTIYTVNNTMSK